LTNDTPTIPEKKACASCGKEFTGGETTCSECGTALTPIHREGLSGTVDGKYVIMCALGDGGWGTVYKAEHILLKRPVAIKTLRRHMVESGTALKRFKQEALAGRQLDHPHILNVLDFGITEDGIPYIVMDYLEGKSLADALEAGGFMEPRRALRIFAQVASALAHAHRNGVVHRDLKPANIMLVEYDGMPDYVKIVDFGIAKIIRSDSDETSQLTETGQLFGSPLYMSPEQCTGKTIDGRSDIYSFGCVMYRTLTGQPPFRVNDLPDCIYKHVNETPASFDSVCPQAQIPKEVEAIVFKCLEKNPNDRFQTMTEVEEAVRTFLEGRPVHVETSLTQSIQTTISAAAATAAPSVSAPNKVSEAPPLNSLAGAQTTSSLEDTTSAEHLPTLAKTEASTAPAPTAPAQSDTTARAAAATQSSLSTSRLVALVSASLLVLIPIAFVFTQRMRPPAVVGPVDNKLITEAAHNAAKPDSAAQAPTSAASLRDGIMKFNQGKYEDALKIFSAAAASSSKQAGNPEALLWEALTLNELFRWDHAKTLLLQYMRHNPEEGVNAARALNGLGFACSNTGQFDEAQGYFDRARRITNTLSGADLVVHAQTLRGQADMLLHRRNYKDAQTMLEQALQIDQQHGAPELEIAHVENDLGQAYEFSKQFDKARLCYDTALTMRQNKLKGSSPRIAYTYTCIASVDFQQKRIADAQSHLKQALSIYKQAMLDSSLTEMQRNDLIIRIANIYESLAAISLSERHYSEALQNYQSALSMVAPVLGESNSQVVRLRKACDKVSRYFSHK
jgi:serine/threonine protein kinase/tetratricopeptide (TPR) repeat protein